MARLCFEEDFINFELYNSTKLTDFSEKAYIVYQDKKYYIVLSNIRNIRGMEVSVNDEIVDINWSSEENGYIIKINRDSPLFCLTYGLTEIVFHIIYDNGNEDLFFSPILSVAVAERYKDNIDSLYEMLDIIYQKNNQMLFQSKSKDAITAGIVKTVQNKPEGEYDVLTAIVQNLNKNYPYFISNPYVLTETKYLIDSIEKLKNIGSKNIQYISMHPEELERSYNYKGIKIGNRVYIPKKTMVTTSEFTKNTYENKMVMAFIWSLYIYVSKKKKEMRNFMEKGEVNITFEHNINDGYVLCDKIIQRHIKLSFESYTEKYQILQNELMEIYGKYSRALLNYPVILNKVPEPTSVFLEIHHYRNIFRLLNLWFGGEHNDILRKNKLLRFSNADRIYEYYCLLGIYDTLIELGYKEIREKRELYHYNVNSLKFSNTKNDNTFYFIKDKCEITLYYQPVVYSYASDKNNNIELFRVDEGYYTPDFIIKKRYDNNISYSIFDAKWRNREALRKDGNEGGLKDLIYKYLYSIADRNTMCCMENLWLLQGKDDDNLEDIWNHRNGTLSRNQNNNFKMKSGIVRYTPKSGNVGLRRVISSFIGE